MKHYNILNGDYLLSELERRILEGSNCTSLEQLKVKHYTEENSEKKFLFELRKFVIKLLKVPVWPSKWYERLFESCKKVSLEPKVRILQVSNTSDSFRLRPSFLAFLDEGASRARYLLGLSKASYMVKKSFLRPHTRHQLFGALSTKFEPQDDNVCNHECTFFLAQDLVLPTQSTPLMLKDKQDALLDFFKVFRRQSRDSTHFCEFHQIEFRKKYVGENPLEALVHHLTVILSCFGVDTSKLQFRKTRYSYTSPSIEVFYHTSKGSIELCGGGILLPQILENYGFELKQNEYYLAAGMGAERLFMQFEGLNSISDCYEVIE